MGNSCVDEHLHIVWVLQERHVSVPRVLAVSLMLCTRTVRDLEEELQQLFSLGYLCQAHSKQGRAVTLHTPSSSAFAEHIVSNFHAKSQDKGLLAVPHCMTKVMIQVKDLVKNPRTLFSTGYSEPCLKAASLQVWREASADRYFLVRFCSVFLPSASLVWKGKQSVLKSINTSPNLHYVLG